MRIRWVLAPVAATLLVAAAVGLPLFQDGSSYVYEILLTGSAVRHHRAIVLFVQAPMKIARHALHALQADPYTTQAVVRTVFSFTYAAIPFVVLGVSWLVVRRRREDLFIWPALVILLVNLVNFSWVSELLIAMQLCWPLLLATLLMPDTIAQRLLAAAIVPTVWLLHPFAAPLLIAMAASAALAGRRTRRSVVVFLIAAISKAGVALASLTKYETEQLAPDDLRTYLFVTPWENAVVLAIALAIGVLCIVAKRGDPERRASRASAALAVLAGALLIAEYVGRRDVFLLKTGLSVFAAMVLMVLAAADATSTPSPTAPRERFRLTVVLAAVFAAVIVTKSILWHRATIALADTLASARAACIETDDDAVAWVHQRRFTILDNWSLPSLALVVQDAPPRTLLLEPGDCGKWADTGIVQLDPWTALEPEDVVPPLR